MENLLNSVRIKKALKALFPFAGLILVFCFFMIGTGGKLLSSTNLENLIDQGFTSDPEKVVTEISIPVEDA